MTWRTSSLVTLCRFRGAKVVARLLKNADLNVWLDIEKLSPGDQWSRELEEALKDSTQFIVLVGESGVRRWVDREVRYSSATDLAVKPSPDEIRTDSEGTSSRLAGCIDPDECR